MPSWPFISSELFQ
jgi:uncharacterized protein with von Willebrand factor type A (vWA) domain